MRMGAILLSLRNLLFKHLSFPFAMTDDEKEKVGPKSVTVGQFPYIWLVWAHFMFL